MIHREAIQINASPIDLVRRRLRADRLRRFQQAHAPSDILPFTHRPSITVEAGGRHIRHNDPHRI
ncbi:MAG: hypothetical protein MK080_12865 [Opitutales bacterium]|nr:hypothetical protein [Opitutales bacterium]NRA27509.1 hypothetical protein [Opitutales bacterium]